MALLAPEPLWDIVDEHLDEAEFLWDVWERALVSPLHTLADVAAGPEARLLAHVDALVALGPVVAQRVLLPAIYRPDAEPSRVCAAALALLQAPGDAGLAAVLAALHELPALRPALARALECGDRPDLPAAVRPLLADPQLRGVAARVLGFHRAPLAEVLPALLASDRPEDVALALQHLPFETAAAKPARAVIGRLLAEDPGVRDAALTAGALLELPQAWRRAQELAAAAEPGCEHALLLLALRGAEDDLPAISAALARPELRTAALWALGFVGTTAALDACLPYFADPLHARIAGEALSACAGVDLADEDLAAPEDDDELLELRPEDELPRPDPVAALMWWTRNRGRFPAGPRLLAGAPRDTSAVLHALHAGPMRRRPALALELVLRTGAARAAAHRLEPRAPTARQLAALAGVTA